MPGGSGGCTLRLAELSRADAGVDERADYPAGGLGCVPFVPLHQAAAYEQLTVRGQAYDWQPEEQWGGVSLPSLMHSQVKHAFVQLMFWHACSPMTLRH